MAQSKQQGFITTADSTAVTRKDLPAASPPSQFAEEMRSMVKHRYEISPERAVDNWCDRELATLSLDQLKRLRTRVREAIKSQPSRPPHRPLKLDDERRPEVARSIYRHALSCGFDEAWSYKITAYALSVDPETIAKYLTDKKPKK